MQDGQLMGRSLDVDLIQLPPIHVSSIDATWPKKKEEEKKKKGRCMHAGSDGWSWHWHLDLCSHFAQQWPRSLPSPNPKYFLLHTSHQIFRRMHGALNVGKKDN
jgi:hypothetical protein